MILFLAIRAVEILFQASVSDEFKSFVAFFSFFELGFEIFALLVFLIALPIILIDAIISRGGTECDD